MSDITIAGATFADVPSILVPKIGGGYAEYTEGGGAWNWMGENTEHISQLYTDEFTLEDAGYSSWTPSTTTKALVASKTAATYVADMANHDYLLRYRFRFDPTYASETTKKALYETECSEMWVAAFRRPNTVANVMARNFAGNSSVTLYSAPLAIYYSTSGVRSYTYAISYGIYPTLTLPSYSNATAASPTMTIKTPTINVRCNSSYFSTASAAAIVADESTVKITIDLYRSDQHATMRSMYDSLLNFYVEGFDA